MTILARRSLYGFLMNNTTVWSANLPGGPRAGTAANLHAAPPCSWQFDRCNRTGTRGEGCQQIDTPPAA